MTGKTVLYAWYVFDRATTQVAHLLYAVLSFFRLNTFAGRQIGLIALGTYVISVLDDHSPEPVASFASVVGGHLTMGAQIITIVVLFLMCGPFIAKWK